jgi:hypothetical protein
MNNISSSFFFFAACLLDRRTEGRGFNQPSVDLVGLLSFIVECPFSVGRLETTCLRFRIIIIRIHRRRQSFKVDLSMISACCH